MHVCSLVCLPVPMVELFSTQVVVVVAPLPAERVGTYVVVIVSIFKQGQLRPRTPRGLTNTRSLLTPPPLCDSGASQRWRDIHCCL